MKLDNKNGYVAYLMIAGKDYVSGKMPMKDAESLCSKGTKISSKFPDYPICVDDKYYFVGISSKPKDEKKKTYGKEK